jgi:hypothetical protein
MNFRSNETAAAFAMAEVMIYNEAKKKWQTPDNSDCSSLCKIEILHHQRNQSFRIIGVRERVSYHHAYTEKLMKITSRTESMY